MRPSWVRLATLATIASLVLSNGASPTAAQEPEPVTTVGKVTQEVSTPHPAALFIGTRSTGKGRATGGAWLSSSGLVIASDEIDTSAVAVCPGDGLAVQVGTENSDDQDSILVRDLQTLDVVERFPVAADVDAAAVSCGDEEASSITLIDHTGAYDARDGQRLAAVGWDRSSPIGAAGGRAFGLAYDEDDGSHTLEVLHVEDGSITPVTKVDQYAFDPSGERVAAFHFGRPRHELTIFDIASIGDPDADADVVEVGRRRLPQGFMMAYSADEGGGAPLYLSWVDPDRLAYIRSEQPDVTNRDLGRVTVIDGADLTTLCTWRGWNVPPVAAADGVLLGAGKRFRSVRRPPRDSDQQMTVFELRRRSNGRPPSERWRIAGSIAGRDAAGAPGTAFRVRGAEPSGLVVPLPGFDADALFGEPTSSCRSASTDDGVASEADEATSDPGPASRRDSGVLATVVASSPAYAQTDAGAASRQAARFEWVEVRPQGFADADLPKDAPGPVIQLAAGPAAMIAAHHCADPCLELLRSTDGTEWQRVSIEGPGTRISALTWAGDAFLALVHDGGTIHPDVRKRPARDRRSCLDAWCRTGSDWYVYRSGDALEWERIDVGETEPRDDLGAIGSGDGLVIGGCVLSKRNPSPSVFGGRMNGCQRAVILTSADGETWERREVKDARWFGDVASDGSTTVVAGFRGEAADDSGRIGSGRPVIMTRPPNGRWSEPRRLLRPGSHPPDLARAPQGGFLLAASGFCDPRDLYDAAHSWLLTSVDGLLWRSLRPCVETSVRNRPTPLGIVSGEGLVASLGFDGTGEITTWWSHDGATWYQQTGGTPSGFPDDYTITADGRLLVASQSERAFWLGRLVPADEVAPIDTAGASRRVLENELLDRVWPIECRRWRRGDKPFEYGARAAIQCDEPSASVAQLALFQFPDSESLSEFWSWRVDGLDIARHEDDSGCVGGQASVASVKHGRVACYLQRGVAKIRWIDERTATYGVLDATDADLSALYSRWDPNDPSSLAPAD